MIKIENVSKSYKDVKAVKNISLTFKEGEIFGLLGRNGSGKSTTFRMLLGLINSDEGDIFYNGVPITKGMANEFGYLPEERALYLQQKVLDQLIYFGKLKGMTTQDATDKAKMYIKKFELEEYEKKKLKTLSKGNQQKVSFIASILHDPKILILDEPLTGFDPVNSDKIKKEIIGLRDSGRIIIFSSHQMHNIQDLCTDLAIIDKGEIVLQGSVKDIRNSWGKNEISIEGDNISLELLENIDGVEKVEIDINSTINIKTDGSEEAIQKVFEKIKNSSITRFEVKYPTLHQIFVDKVGGQNG